MDIIFVIIICILSAALSIWLGEEIDARAKSRRIDKKKAEELCDYIHTLEKSDIIDEAAAEELKKRINCKYG